MSNNQKVRIKLAGLIGLPALIVTVAAVSNFGGWPPVAQASVYGAPVAQPPVPTALTKSVSADVYAQMSPMGALAHAMSRRASGQAGPSSGDTCLPGEDCGDGYQEGPASGQAETSIAVDSSGQHIVVGFNDTRGFSKSPISVSGFMYSDDGGVTFVDGGQLPTPVTSTLGSVVYPQVFGDPEVKYAGGSTFLYFSILMRVITGTSGIPGSVETMAVHRSVDNGHTWQGPFEVPCATNPHNLFSGNNARDAADKEFADVDPDTGRVLMSWSNFTPTTVEISTCYSGDITSATPPTWSSRSILNASSATFDTGSIPRFAGNGSGNAYVAYSRQNTTTGVQNEAVAVSGDNGQTWGAPANLNETN